MPTIDASRPAGLPDYSGTTAAGIERETATAIAAAEALVDRALELHAGAGA